MSANILTGSPLKEETRVLYESLMRGESMKPPIEVDMASLAEPLPTLYEMREEVDQPYVIPKGHVDNRYNKYTPVVQCGEYCRKAKKHKRVKNKKTHR